MSDQSPKRAVHKYNLEADGPTILKMAASARFVGVGLQVQLIDDTPQLRPIAWAIVNTDEPPAARTVALFNTGEELDQRCPHYIGTLMGAGAVAVAHVFASAP